MPRGRPKVYQTEQARKAARVKARAKFRNIAIDSDLVEQLSAVANGLEAQLGFRPTLSQTLRYLLNKLPNESKAKEMK